jgi:predicted negative regulator of RcsB-dependent stress response
MEEKLTTENEDTDDAILDNTDDLAVDGAIEIPVDDINELEELKNMVIAHGTRILVGVCVGLLIVGGVSLFKTNKQQKLVDSSRILSTARSMAELESLTTKYAETPAAPLALLKIAKMHYNDENLDMAKNLYLDFQEKYPEHPLYLAAGMGELHCTEATGETEQALHGYTAFANENPDNYLTSQAVFGQGRCLVSLGRNQEAKELYEEFMGKNPESEWLPMLEEKLAEATDADK